MATLDAALISARQETMLLQSVLRTISNVMPATTAQRSRWQEEEARPGQEDHDASISPQEVLEQVQSYIHHVQAEHDRYNRNGRHTSACFG